ncbi:MAG: DUF1254 domain-containing protein, partial [Eggerthellaceae bacterium]|nr:DUF1254 domain-containing protein [Eggerthellaceae bacterium]
MSEQASEQVIEQTSAKPVKEKKVKQVKLNKKGKVKTHHFRVFILFLLASLVVVTFGFVAIYPSLAMNGYRKAILVNGLGTGSPIPVNTYYTVPYISNPTDATANILTAGANQDTLYSGAWLDLSKGPLVLSVPDMNDRYYALEFVNAKDNSVINTIGKRTTGTGAGSFFITGPGWSGTVPSGMTQITSPNNEVLLLGRVFVADDSEVQLVYNLS